MSKTEDNNNRVWLLRLGGIYLIIALAFVAILVKVLYLQIARHDSELEKQNKRIIQERSYQAKRGNIYSIDYDTGELMMLATDVPIYDMYIDLGKQKNKETGKAEWVVPHSTFKKELKPMYCLQTDQQL